MNAAEKARQYGYEGFEPRISAGHKHGIECRVFLRSKMERNMKIVIRETGSQLRSSEIVTAEGKE